MRGLGLTYSPQQLETFLSDLFEESKRFNSRQLESDWAFIYVDAKVIDLVDDSGAIKKAVHFTALGVNLECKKEFESKTLRRIWTTSARNLPCPRRNSGGYFHSERELAVKTKIIFDNLSQGKWRNPIPRFASNLAQINQFFCERFEE